MIQPSISQSYENLFAFEYDTANEDDFESSVQTWSNFLQSILQTYNNTKQEKHELVSILDKSIIESILRPYQNTRKQSLHSNVIYNYQEIVNVLQNANLTHYFFLYLFNY